MSPGPRFRAGLAKLRLLIVALSVVIVARLAVAAQRSRRLERHIVKIRDRASPPSRPLVHDLREIAWSVSATARLVPGATCLTQALAGDWLLARRGRTGGGAASSSPSSRRGAGAIAPTTDRWHSLPP